MYLPVSHSSPKNWNLSGCLMNGLRADAVRVLAPRTCEGGGTSAHTGTGGSPSSAYLSQIRVKNKSVNTKDHLFDAFGNSYSPRHQFANWWHPPRKRGGQGVYPPAYLNCPSNFQFICLLWNADMHLSKSA